MKAIFTIYHIIMPSGHDDKDGGGSANKQQSSQRLSRASVSLLRKEASLRQVTLPNNGRFPATGDVTCLDSSYFIGGMMSGDKYWPPLVRTTARV